MRFIKIPFASSGDKTIPPATDPAGGINYTQGYPIAYSRDPGTDPSAKRIERELFNGLLNDITSAINELQTTGVAPYINADDNGGSAYAYGKGALVSLGGVIYLSLVASNTTTPPGVNWSAIPEKIQPLDATLIALAGLVGAANKLAYFNGADTAALTDLTQVGRDVIGQPSIANLLTYLGLKTAAQRDVGTGANQIPDMASFASGPGYLKLPGGWIIQWGSSAASNSSGQAIATFPIAFISAVTGVALAESSNSASAVTKWGSGTMTTTTGTFWAQAAGGTAAAQGELVNYIVIGK